MTALFTFRRGNTLIHKAPPIVKLVILLLVSLTIFSSVQGISDWFIIAFYATFACMLFFLAKTPVKHILKLKFVLYMGAFVTIFRVFKFTPFSIDVSQISEGMLYTSRFFVATVFVLVFFETTSTSQITDSLKKVQDCISFLFPPLKGFFYKHNPARIIGLAIGFIPRVFATWQKVHLASLSRSMGKKQNRLANFIFTLEVQFSALLSCMINIAETTRKAVINRSEDL